ncbi:MAG: MFS transporter [Caldimicrobium sp.]|nr:MFS transporter [Caldimicrobium sp.]
MKIPFEVFKIKNFRLFLLGHFLSFLGSWVQNTAVHWLVYINTGSSAKLGFFSLLTTMPGVVFTLFSGSIIDRLDRWRLFRIILLLSILPPLFLGIFFSLLGFNLYIVVLLTLIGQILSAVDMPLRQVCISNIVPPEYLTQALSFQALSFHTSRILGSSLGGYLMALFSPEVNFWLNALSYLPFIVFLRRIKPENTEVYNLEKRSLKKDFSELYKFLRQVKLTYFLILQVAVFSFLGVSFPIVLPRLAVEAFSGKALEYGLVSSILGCGAMFGALSLGFRASESQNVCKRVWLTQLLFSLSLLLIALSQHKVFTLLGIFLMGFSFTNFFPIINSSLQRSTPEGLRGRVMSLFTFAFTGTVPIGQLFSGFLVDILGIKVLSFALSLSIMFISSLFYLKTQRLEKVCG